MADGFAVGRAALAETAKRLNDVIGALSGLGIDETGEVGRGFSELALSGFEAGDSGRRCAYFTAGPGVPVRRPRHLEEAFEAATSRPRSVAWLSRTSLRDPPQEVIERHIMKSRLEHTCQRRT